MIRYLINRVVKGIGTLYRQTVPEKIRGKARDLLVANGIQLIPRRLEMLGLVIYSTPSSAFNLFETLLRKRTDERKTPINLLHLGASISADENDPMLRLFADSLFCWHCYEPHPDAFKELCGAVEGVLFRNHQRRSHFLYQEAVCPKEFELKNGRVDFSYPRLQI
jgi:hypothetical protein